MVARVLTWGVERSVVVRIPPRVALFSFLWKKSCPGCSLIYTLLIDMCVSVSVAINSRSVIFIASDTPGRML